MIKGTWTYKFVVEKSDIENCHHKITMKRDYHVPNWRIVYINGFPIWQQVPQ